MDWVKQEDEKRSTYTASVGGTTYTITKARTHRLFFIEDGGVQKAKYLTYIYRITVTSKDGKVKKLPFALLLEQAKQVAEKHAKS